MTATELRDIIIEAKERLDLAEKLLDSATLFSYARMPELAHIHTDEASKKVGEAYARLGRALFAPAEGAAPEAKRA